jgi:isopropylmalate/homocitrate/citramalate synthase
VQGTINGFGERCGNANLVSIVPILQLKRGYGCVTPAQLRKLGTVSRTVYELANIEPNKRRPSSAERVRAQGRACTSPPCRRRPRRTSTSTRRSSATRSAC